MPELEGQVDGGLAIESEEAPIFGWVLIQVDLYMEGAFDSAHCACHLDVQRIARATGNREAVRLRKLKDSIEVFLAGAEAFREPSFTLNE
jgi:hypothetical protein